MGAGAALDALPFAATAALERLWVADGDGDYRLLGPLSQLSAALVEGVEVRTRWPVGLVERRDGGGAVVWSEDGRQRLSVDGVVVAVPLPLLVPTAAGEAAAVRFSPPLAAAKQAAMRSIATLGAVKVCAVFSSRTWREAEGAPLHSVLCAGCAVPEVWMRPRHGGLPGVVVHGFATGSYADALGAMSPPQLLDAFLAQLSRVLPGADLASLRGALIHWQARARGLWARGGAGVQGLGAQGPGATRGGRTLPPRDCAPRR